MKEKHEVEFNFGPLDRVKFKVKNPDFNPPNTIVVDGVEYQLNKIGTYSQPFLRKTNHHSYWYLKDGSRL